MVKAKLLSKWSKEMTKNGNKKVNTHSINVYLFSFSLSISLKDMKSYMAITIII